MNRLSRWPVAVLTAVDRLANALLLGDDRSTISSRIYFASEKGKAWAKWPRRILDWISPDHCKRAAEFDAAVRQVLATPPT